MGILVKQIVVRRPLDGDGFMTQTVWVNRIDELKVGLKITFKHDPNTWWEIVSVGSKALDNELLYKRHGKPILRSIQTPGSK